MWFGKRCWWRARRSGVWRGRWASRATRSGNTWHRRSRCAWRRSRGHGRFGRKVVPRIEALLEESPRWTGGKQRLTAARLHTMLMVEGFEVGQTTVKAAVAEWKRKRRKVFVPLVYPAGDLAEWTSSRCSSS